MGDVHTNALLTNLSIAYRNEAVGYVADQVFPPVKVSKQSDIILKYDKDYWYRDEAKVRAPGGPVELGGYTINKDSTYLCINYAIGRELTDETMANQDAPIDLESEAVQWISDRLLMRREVDFATNFMAAAAWDTDVSVTAKFNLYATSDPIGDVDTAKRTVAQLIGREPNMLIMGRIVYDRLKRHPDLLDLIKYTQRAIVDTSLMANLFSVEKLLVGNAVYTTGLEGAASFTYTPILDDDMLLLYSPPGVGLMTPTAGKTFVWRPLTGGDLQFIRRYRDDVRRRLVIEGHTYYDQVATSSAAGADFIDCTD